MRLHSQETYHSKYHHQYLVNNSFHPGLQHKRVSFDTSLYCLMHKKILRKAVIEQGFQDSLTSFKHSSLQTQKGFRGKLTPSSTIYQQKHYHKTQYQLDQQRKEQQRQIQLEAQRSFNRARQQKKIWMGHQTFSSRPNMMCNLDLYRKGFKRMRFKTRVVPKRQQKNINKESQGEWHRMKTVI